MAVEDRARRCRTAWRQASLIRPTSAVASRVRAVHQTAAAPDQLPTKEDEDGKRTMSVVKIVCGLLEPHGKARGVDGEVKVGHDKGVGGGNKVGRRLTETTLMGRRIRVMVAKMRMVAESLCVNLASSFMVCSFLFCNSR
jgi:hypothetical protein